jgi:putative holliday junction resolvase
MRRFSLLKMKRPWRSKSTVPLIKLLYFAGAVSASHNDISQQQNRRKGALMSLTSKKRVIAIDYGKKRIGVAQCDPLWLFAQPVGTFDRAGLSGVLAAMVKQDDIALVLVGYPLSDGDESNAMTGVVDRFIEELRAEFPQLKIETVDEHHSSKSAGQILIASGRSRKKRQQKGRLDSAAACVLLSEYLENLESCR